MAKYPTIRRSLVLLALLFVAACARYALVDAVPQTIGGEMTVRPSLQWNRIEHRLAGDVDASEVWTIDGQQLQSLIFVVALQDGEPLLSPHGGSSDEKVPRFRASMTRAELADLFEASFSRYAESSVFEFSAITPVPAFGTDGIRMEFSFAAQDSIDRDGVAVAAVRAEHLYLIVYQGTHLYYFEKYLPEVERIIASATLASEA